MLMVNKKQLTSDTSHTSANCSWFFSQYILYWVNKNTYWSLGDGLMVFWSTMLKKKNTSLLSTRTSLWHDISLTFIRWFSKQLSTLTSPSLGWTGKTTSGGILDDQWSPIHVLSRLDNAWMQWSDGICCTQRDKEVGHLVSTVMFLSKPLRFLDPATFGFCFLSPFSSNPNFRISISSASEG